MFDAKQATEHLTAALAASERIAVINAMIVAALGRKSSADKDDIAKAEAELTAQQAKRDEALAAAMLVLADAWCQIADQLPRPNAAPQPHGRELAYREPGK